MNLTSYMFAVVHLKLEPKWLKFEQLGRLSAAFAANSPEHLAMAQNYQPPKWMVFLLNMIISVGHWYHNFEPNPSIPLHPVSTAAFCCSVVSCARPTDLPAEQKTCHKKGMAQLICTKDIEITIPILICQLCQQHLDDFHLSAE